MAESIFDVLDDFFEALPEPNTPQSPLPFGLAKCLFCGDVRQIRFMKRVENPEDDRTYYACGACYVQDRWDH